MTAGTLNFRVGIAASLVATTIISVVALACTPSVSEMEKGDFTQHAVTVDLPVEGTWKLVRSPGHERFAFDLVAVDDSHRPLRVSRLRHLLGRAGVEVARSWNEPVFAPVDGTVAAARDGWPDRRRLHLVRDLWNLIFSRPEMDSTDLRPWAGNHVIIRSDTAAILLAHMREGSVRVDVGEEVHAGQLLGRAGNSGQTLEPHLHFQLIDDLERLPHVSAPPFRVAQFERWSDGGWARITDSVLEKGDVIRSRVPRDRADI